MLKSLFVCQSLIKKRIKSQLITFLSLIIFISPLITGCQNVVENTTVDGVTKITFWHGINPPENRDIFNELLEEFNRANPDIEVEGLYVGQPDEQLPRIIASVVGNQPPDILWYVPQLTGKLVELQALKPLEEWFNNSPLKAEIEPAMLSTMVLDDHIWSIPFATNNTAMFYRPSLFRDAGISELPNTWEEFAETADQLTKDLDNNGSIDQYGALLSLGTGEFTVFVWLPFIYSANGTIVENNRANLVNEGTQKALQLGAELIENNVAILSPPDRGYELDDFIAGRVAMQVTGPWTLAQLRQSGIDYDVFPLPVIDTPATVLGGENLFVFKTNSEREKASLKFLEYILSAEFQTQWALKTGYLPINVKVQETPEYQQFVEENPVINVFLEQMKNAQSRPIIADYPTISENLGRAIESSLLRQKTPQQALQESQQRLELSLGK
jgi:multiple sugar transport system substrate-binding protein